MQRIAILAVLAASAGVSPAAAATVFLSTSATDPTAADGLPVPPPGEQASAYVWVEPDPGQKIIGASLDFVSTVAGAINVLDFEVFNPSVAGSPRWQGAIDGGDLNFTDTTIVAGTLAVAVTTHGINQSFVGFGLDPLEVNGSFLHAKMTFEVVGGVPQIYPVANAINPFVAAGEGAVDVEFGGLPFFSLNTFVLRDTNDDGQVNTLDINPFVLALTDPAAYTAAFPRVDVFAVADVNRDGRINTLDVGPFTAAVVEPVDSGMPEPAGLIVGLAAAWFAACQRHRRRR